MRAEERRGLAYVALAVIFFSTSPVFILWADPMDPFVKTWGRMLVAAVAVGFASLFARNRPAVGTSESQPLVIPALMPAGLHPAVRFATYGLIAALHFLFYIAALNFTSAAHTLAIVYTAPVFVTFFSAAFLKEHIRSRQWVGVGVAVVGIAILAGLQPQLNWTMAFGDLLALLSAIMFALYSVAGRSERGRYPLLVYASRVYSVAALWLLPAALISIPSMPAAAWGWRQVISILALGLGPLALGHTLYNASLRRVHATYVNIIASQEVTGGIILSWLLLGQVPSLNSLLGALVTLIGIGLILR